MCWDYLVTGGMGFIGRHTIAALIAAHPDARIVCLDNLSSSQEIDFGRGVDLVRGDVADTWLVSRLVAGTRRAVIHLAADSRILPTLADPDRVIDTVSTNVAGTAAILAAIAASPHPLHLVYAGSSSVYGRDVPQYEDDLPAVASPYAATKLAGELLVRSFVVTFHVSATVLRYFQVYGPGQPELGAYALVTGIFLRQAAAGMPLTIEGYGTQTRDFVHVEDVAAANIAALEHNSAGLPINIGSGHAHSIKELADLISPDQVFVPARPVDLKATLADIGRAKRLLGWAPTITLADGIAEMLSLATHG